MNENDSPISKEISQWLGKSHQLLMRYNFLFSKKQGLSFAQMTTLHHINHCHHCSVNDISRFLSISPPAVSQLVDKLVQMKLVERKENPDDRRQKSHYLTSKGKKLLNKKHQYSHQWVEDLITEIPEEEKESLTSALSLLNRCLMQTIEEKENT